MFLVGSHKLGGILMGFVKSERDKKGNHLNHKGFSFIELLVSIAILAIVLVPLLSNFVTAARVNAKARKIQNETLLGQSILEDIKSKTVQDMGTEYDDYYEAIPMDGVTYYAKKDVEYDGSDYDILLTLDSNSYKVVNPTNPEGEKIGYNTFRMPIISEINNSKNILAMESFETDLAVATLHQNHILYCEQERGKHKEDPSFSISEYSIDDIRKYLQKQINISITQSDSDIYAKVVFEYSSSSESITIPGSGTESYTVVEKQLSDIDGNIYLFYNPSYSDRISISKDILITDEIDIYVAKQELATPIISIPEQLIGTIPVGIHLYSNVDYGYGSIGYVKKDEAKNRIYDVKVQLFKAGTNFAPEELCVEFQTTKEE